MASLMDRLKKTSKIPETSVLTDSKFFQNREKTPTPVPMINVALSGELDGGLSPGFTLIAGDSKHFKTSYALLMAAAYLKAHEDAVLMFYDSEFGSPQDYFESFGIDPDRVLHTPIVNIETLKFDLVNQLESLDDDDKVFIVIDSIGNVASKKELDDAINEKSVADMTRAKSLKGLFRMVTPYLTMKNISMVGIAHVYDEMGLFPKKIVSGGKGIYYSANEVWIVTRSQEKSGSELTGYSFNINIEKSRSVKEKSRIPITVSFDGGINKYSGLMALAIEAGMIKQSGAWYQVMDFETGEIIEKKLRANAIGAEFYDELIQDENFKTFVRNKYKLVNTTIISEEVEYADED